MTSMLEVDVALLAVVAGDRGQIRIRSWGCNQPLGPGLYGAVAGKLMIVTSHPSLTASFSATEDGIMGVGVVCIDISELTEACLGGDSTDGFHLIVGPSKKVMSAFEELSLSPKTPSSLRGFSAKASAANLSSSMACVSGVVGVVGVVTPSDSYSDSESTSPHSWYMTRLLACGETYANVG